MALVAYIQIEEDQPFKCVVPDGLAVHKADLCIIEIDNVLDIGRVHDLEDIPDLTNADRKIPQVVRCATLQDQAKADEGSLRSKMAMDKCATFVEKHKLAMRLIKVRFSFDRKILLVNFVAEDRVDYRDLIKDLASELHARVEMKQIGVRDEAGMIGGIGPCGRNLCCCTWLKNFESINVKMAKAQRLSLNPAAISGMCGRLKCCLRYEYDQYKDADRALPRDGDCVSCPGGKGCVCGKDILAGKVKVRLEDHKIMQYDACDVEPARNVKPQKNDRQQSGGSSKKDNSKADSSSEGK